FITKYVPRDDDFIAWMIKKEAAFWQHVIDGTMPAIDGSESCGKVLERLHPKENGQTVEIPKTAKQWLLVRRDAMEEIEKWQDNKKEAENQIKRMLGDNQIGTVDGVVIAEWKTIEKKAYTVAASSRRQLYIRG
ncbi:MAG: hypothetical protein P4N59_18515, partial [Negativicutes bacterium]|nr:hypothetical protein [Negativicutes bacterium]